MKKTTLCALTALLLAVLSLAIFLGAQAHLSARGEGVTVTETPLFGDQKEAEGVTVKTTCRSASCATLMNNMGWDVTYSIRNGKTAAKTKFQYAKARESAENPVGQAYLETTLADSWFAYDPSDTADLETPLPSACLQEVLDQTENGKTLTKTFDLLDYYDNYPVYLNCQEADFTNIMPDQAPVDYSYFQIPIKDSFVYQATVKKAPAGNLDEVEITAVTDSDRQLDTASVCLPEDCVYTALTGIQVDDAWQPAPADMRGIHRIPLKRLKQDEPDDALCPDMDHAEKVFDLDAGQHLVKLEVDPDGETLLLFTQDRGLRDGDSAPLTLSVIRIRDMKLLQKLDILPGSLFDLWEDSLKLQYSDGYLLAVVNQNQFALLTKEADAQIYQLKEQGALRAYGQDLLPENTWIERLTGLYDGSRLILAAQPGIGDFSDISQTLCSTYLFVVKGGKLVYGGFYENSLDQVPRDDTRQFVYPSEKLTLTLDQ